MLFVYSQCLHRTGLHTGRLNTLSALGHGEVIREFAKRILKDLDPGKRKIFCPFMNQGAGQHARKTALTLLGVDEQISLRGRDCR
jgi:hypothetical protein